MIWVELSHDRGKNLQPIMTEIVKRYEITTCDCEEKFAYNYRGCSHHLNMFSLMIFLVFPSLSPLLGNKVTIGFGSALNDRYHLRIGPPLHTSQTVTSISGTFVVLVLLSLFRDVLPRARRSAAFRTLRCGIEAYWRRLLVVVVSEPIISLFYEVNSPRNARKERQSGKWYCIKAAMSRYFGGIVPDRNFPFKVGSRL